MQTLVLLLLGISCYGNYLQQVDAAAGFGQGSSSGGTLYAAAPKERGSYAVGGAKGQSHYGYNTGDGIAKVEVRQPSGTVYGSYRYFDPNGKQVIRSYIADSKGFRVLGNDLPISPDTPVSKVEDAPAFTGAVEGTSEFNIPSPLYETSGNDQQSQNIQPVQSHQVSQAQTAALQRHQQAHQAQLNEIEKLKQELLLLQQKISQLQSQQQIDLQPAPSQIQQQHIPQQHFSNSIQTQQTYRETPNTLTGGVTSPYFVYNSPIDYNFPAGFAHSSLSGSKYQPQPQPQSNQKRGCYPGSNEPGCGHSYIIGRAR